jgi:hypothetical protein
MFLAAEHLSQIGLDDMLADDDLCVTDELVDEADRAAAISISVRGRGR